MHDLRPDQMKELKRKLLAGEPLEIAGMKFHATFRLEKFDGEYQAGQEPVEVIEGGDGLPTTVTRKGETNGT